MQNTEKHPAIDFKALLVRLGGDRELMGELLDVFVEDTPVKLVALREAQAAGDLHEVSRRAHAIKGSAAAVNAEAARACAAALEAAGEAGDQAASDRLIPDLVARLEAVVTAIGTFKKQ